MADVKEIIKNFVKNNPKLFYAMKSWKALQNKPYPLMDMFVCVYNAANGSLNGMKDIIERLTAKRKVYGRAQVTDRIGGNVMDIRDNGNGELQLYGNDAYNPMPLKGQHTKRNPKIFKKDGDINKNYQRSEEKIMDLGQRVREVFPSESETFISLALKAVHSYAALHKINPNRVIDKLENGRLKMNYDTMRIVNENIHKGRTIYINESDAEALKDLMKMTEYKFNSNIKYFISKLLEDPVNTELPETFRPYGLTRSSLLRNMIDCGLLQKIERISDKDEFGEPKTATMLIRFKCPKKNFERNLRNLFIKLFEKNLPQRTHKINEEGAAGGSAGSGNGAIGGTPAGATTAGISSGQYTKPAFSKKDNKGDEVYSRPIGGIIVNKAE